MKGLISFIKEALSSGDGASSKRLISFVTCVSMIVSFFVAQATGKSAPQYMFDTLGYIVMFGLGAVATEVVGKFSKSGNDEKPSN